MSSVFDLLKINYISTKSVGSALKAKADVYVFAGLDPNKNCTINELNQIYLLVAGGGKVLLLN
jgi:beta-galactosidase